VPRVRATPAQLAEWVRKGLVRLPAPRPAAFGVRVVVPVPPSTNRIWRAVVVNGAPQVLKSREYRAWLKSAVPLLRKVPPPAAYPVEVCVLILPGRGWRVTADVQNREKALTDALVQAEALPGDDQRYVAGVRLAVDRQRPRGKATEAAVWLVPAARWWETRGEVAGG
jgi:Holliday junction resolvase RusA-like endonuclease